MEQDIIGKIVNAAVSHRKIVIILWVIGILLLTPVIISYTNHVSYSNAASGSSHSESTKASDILSKINPQNSSLTVVVSVPSANNLSIANSTLNFQKKIASSSLKYISTSESAFSVYESFLDEVYGKYFPLINQTYSAVSNESSLIFKFPSSFYQQWMLYGYNSTEIYAAADRAGYTNSTSQNFFLSALNDSLKYYSQLGPYYNVYNATSVTAQTFDSSSQYTDIILKYGNLNSYSSYNYLIVQKAFLSLYGYSIPERVVYSAVNSANPGNFYVRNYGLSGAPSFIYKQYVSPDNTTYLISIILNVPQSYRGANDFYPAQSIVPQIRNYTSVFFHNQGSVTGNGAISYDLQSTQGDSFIGFIFTFVFLAIIVGLVLRSYISPILSIVLVSIATVLGYASVFIVGVIYEPVNYIVTYTLTAVLLGVSTDYLLFILSRFREELANGKTSEEAIRSSAEKSGKAVAISGLTVATSLGSLFFISGLNTWGPVLFIAVLLTVLAEITLLPALSALLGRRIFRKLPSTEIHKSIFYRAGQFSSKRRKAVLAAILIVAVPAVYFWFEAPVTYDLSGELPANLPSVIALNTVNEKFGGSALYPVFVIYNLSTPAFSGGNVSPVAYNEIASAQNYIKNTPGVTDIIGPSAANGSIHSSAFLFNNNRSVYFIVDLNYTPYSQNAIQSVQHLRDNSSFIVGGLTSGIIDLKDSSQQQYSVLEILIVAAIAIIIGVSFRSIKFPLIALSGVFISISWTLGILYVVITYILHESLIFLIPVILFIILMSLGNDFTVFLISRIKEEQEKHGFTEGLYRGMGGSGYVVTALGVILAASLGSLGLVPIAFLQQLGLAFAVSLLVDTFVIRSLYFPAMISLLRRKKEVIN
jgi:RND superfamily putative drug exporter